MKEILSDLVSTRTARDGDRNDRTGFALLKNGISGFISADLNPVVVWEMSDCMRRLPVRSTVELRRLKEPLRSTPTPGI